MLIEQLYWTSPGGWVSIKKATFSNTPQLVLAFGNRRAIGDPARFKELKAFYPTSNIMFCSTAGEIVGNKVVDNSIIATVIYFEKTKVRYVKTSVNKRTGNDFDAGKFLIENLAAEDLCHVFVISDGQQVNGTELVKGMNQLHQGNIPITGGLAGDGANFEKTLVGINEPPAEGNIVAIGFYGNALKVGHGSKGGWDPFGPERIVTKSYRNILYELDHQSALQLYKKYLGPLSNELPSSALLFPLCIRLQGHKGVIVRTILSIDDETQSMTFAGDIPQGATVQLMKANFERLVDGAIVAAESSLQTMGSFKPELAVLVSCVGRRLVLSDRTEEEIEEVTNVLGSETAITGFYSYGEISPLLNATTCELHNQTMTITTYSEK